MATMSRNIICMQAMGQLNIERVGVRREYFYSCVPNKFSKFLMSSP